MVRFMVSELPNMVPFMVSKGPYMVRFMVCKLPNMVPFMVSKDHIWFVLW